MVYGNRLEYSQNETRRHRDDRPARLILNRRPPAEGWAWLKYEDDGQEFEADLGTVQLVALLEG